MTIADKKWTYGIVPDLERGGVFVAEIYDDGCYAKLNEADWWAENKDDLIETIKIVLRDLEDDK